MTLIIAFTVNGYADDTWTVAGSAAALNGSDSWAEGNTANDMTSGDGTNFTLVVTDCTLETGTDYKFKVVKNHAWGESYPASNQTFTVTETAVYTVTYTFNSDTKAVGVTTTKTGEAGVVSHTYTVAGSDADILDAAWDPTSSGNDMTLESGTKYILVKENVTISEETTIQWKVCVDHGWSPSYGDGDNNKSSTISEAGTYDLVFVFDTSDNSLDFVYVSSVDLRGTFSEWGDAGVLTRTGVGTYTGTLDLSSTVDDQEFKLVVSNPITTGGTYGWLGVGSISVTAPTGWLGGDNNFTLYNSTAGYKTFNFTATWTPGSDNCANWTLTIEGGTQRAYQTYTLNFVNNPNWNDVYCYAWDGDYKSLGAWPGTKMTETNGTQEIGGTSYDKYTATYTFYEPAIPTKVIFNNGSEGVGRQTADLTIANNETYSGPVYYVVGNQDIFGNDNLASSTALMTGNDGVYTIEFTDEILSSDISYKIVEKEYYDSDDNNWYPYNYQSLSIPVKGKYNVTISFDGSKDMNASASVDGSSATKTYEAVTIGATGWATTVTNSPLNFAGLTENFKAYTATLVGATPTVTLVEVANVQAETGIVLKGDEGTFYAPVTESSTAQGFLYGSSIDTYTVNNEFPFYCYGLAINESGDAQFRKIADGVIIPAQKAYLRIGKSVSANELTVSFGDPTGINTVNGSRLTVNGEMYNLAGQKVNKGFKGIVIVNGQKVMIK